MYNDDYYIGQIIVNICNGKVYGPFEVDYVRSEEDFDENFSSWNLEHGYSMLDILDLNTGELHTREDTSSFDADVTENELIKLLFGKGS